MRVSVSVLALLSVSHATRVKLNATNEWWGGGGEKKTFTGKEPSPFKTYISQSKEKGCPPRAFRSTCPKNKFNGVVVFIHGFSGCSDQADKLGAHLSKECFDVLAPTLPGHGTPLQHCNKDFCSVKIAQGRGFDLRLLPSHEKGYIDFTKSLVGVLEDEQAHRAAQLGKAAPAEVPVSILGFALGAPVALTAAMESPHLFSRLMLVNPYFAMGDEAVDRKAVQCEADARSGTGKIALEECRQQAILDSLSPLGVESVSGGTNKYFNWLASSRGTFEKRLFCNLAKASNAFGGKEAGDGTGMLDDLMEGERSWGSVCRQSLQHGRKGFCKFKTKHSLALHAFAIRALVSAQAWGAWNKGTPQTQIIATERDGRTRNGMSYKIAQHLAKQDLSDASMCLHRYKKGVNQAAPANYWNDQLVMPHAVMMPKNAHGWWEKGLYEKIADFLIRKKHTKTSNNWNGNRDECMSLPLDEATFKATPALQKLVVPEAASSSKVNCVWVGPLWKTVEAYDSLPKEYKKK